MASTLVNDLTSMSPAPRIRRLSSTSPASATPSPRFQPLSPTLHLACGRTGRLVASCRRLVSTLRTPAPQLIAYCSSRTMLADSLALPDPHRCPVDQRGFSLLTTGSRVIDGTDGFMVQPRGGARRLANGGSGAAVIRWPSSHQPTRAFLGGASLSDKLAEGTTVSLWSGDSTPGSTSYSTYTPGPLRAG